MDKQVDQFSELVQQAKDVQLPFGISLFDIIIVLIVFLIVNKIMGGKLVEAIKAKLGGAKAPEPPPVSLKAQAAANADNPEWKPGVEDVHSVLVASGIPTTDADTFVKANWEKIRPQPK